MVLIKEFRVTLPMTVEEYRVAQRYAVAKSSRIATEAGKGSDGSGVEVLVNEPYDDHNGKGQYTHKIYHLGSHVPGFIAALLKKDMLKLDEKAWNGYPHCRTELTNVYFGNKIKFIIETMHLPDRGETENALNKPADILKQRVVDYIDIAHDKVEKKDYKAEEDPTKWHSTKTGRGPLTDPNWRKTCDPVMTAYKMVTVEVNLALIGGKAERFTMDFERKIFQRFHRQVVCWMDDWFGLDMEDVQYFEDETQAMLAGKPPPPRPPKKAAAPPLALPAPAPEPAKDKRSSPTKLDAAKANGRPSSSAADVTASDDKHAHASDERGGRAGRSSKRVSSEERSHASRHRSSESRGERHHRRQRGERGKDKDKDHERERAKEKGRERDRRADKGKAPADEPPPERRPREEHDRERNLDRERERYAEGAVSDERSPRERRHRGHRRGDREKAAVDGDKIEKAAPEVSSPRRTPRGERSDRGDRGDRDDRSGRRREALQPEIDRNERGGSKARESEATSPRGNRRTEVVEARFEPERRAADPSAVRMRDVAVHGTSPSATRPPASQRKPPAPSSVTDESNDEFFTATEGERSPSNRRVAPAPQRRRQSSSWSSDW